MKIYSKLAETMMQVFIIWMQWIQDTTKFHKL